MAIRKCPLETLELMIVESLPLSGLKKIKRSSFSDHRGFFSRLFCEKTLKAAGFIKPVSQINHSVTLKQGSIRGLHAQRPPHSEMKLVTCLSGKIWDVAVDIRKNSPTFLKWYATVLSEENQDSLLIPEGFAHGFQSLSNNTCLIYCHSHGYEPSFEIRLHPKDPMLNIDWPLEIQDLSEKDQEAAFIEPQFQGI